MSWKYFANLIKISVISDFNSFNKFMSIHMCTQEDANYMPSLLTLKFPEPQCFCQYACKSV